MKDLDIFSTDVNLLEKVSHFGGVVEDHCYDGMIMPNSKHAKVICSDILFEICLSSNLTDLTCDFNVNSIAFNLKTRKFTFIDSNEEKSRENIQRTIGDICNLCFEFNYSKDRLNTNIFLSHNYAMFRIAKNVVQRLSSKGH